MAMDGEGWRSLASGSVSLSRGGSTGAGSIGCEAVALVGGYDSAIGSSACSLSVLEGTLPNLETTASATMLESSGSILASADFKTSLSG